MSRRRHSRQWRERFLWQWSKRYGYAACYYCKVRIRLTYRVAGVPAAEDEATLDHLIPLSRGGEDKKDNLVWSCYRCNYEKADIRLF